MRIVVLLFFGIVLFIPCVKAQSFDIAINGGRVIDPETGLDAIRNVGINGDRIAIITDREIRGQAEIDARGMVVSPGFIDPHVHGITNEAHEYQLHDGVTTALELEGGVGFISYWLESKRGKSLVNYGASVQHAGVRVLSQKQYQPNLQNTLERLDATGFSQDILDDLFVQLVRSRTVELSSDELAFMYEQLVRELEGGAVGIGVPVGYYPNADEAEILGVYQLAADKDVPIYSHVREKISGVQQAMANAAATGAALHIVHLNSMALGDIQVGLDLVAGAQAQGLRITTEVYPYTAASTSLESVIFDDGWKEKLGISYGDLQWQATGERLTDKTFYEYRKKGGVVIIHLMHPDWIRTGVASPVAMIGSDGMPYAPLAHPRTAGTYARVLGKYVREDKVLTLQEALRKMTIMPAKQLELAAPGMRLKGRLQVGCDADITIFDPETIRDRADFEKGLSFSEGIPYVLVNGILVVDKGKTVEGVFPGRPVMGKYAR